MQYEPLPNYGTALYTTAQANALDSLEMVETFLHMERASKWKWAALGLYQALYGFLLTALGGTAPYLYLAELPRQRRAICLSVVSRLEISAIAKQLNTSESNVQEWIANPKVIGIADALKRMKAVAVPTPEVGDHLTESELRSCRGDSEPARPISVRRLILSDSQSQSIDWFIRELRNPLEHFMPKHWYIQVSGLPARFLAVLDAIEFIALHSHGLILPPEEEKDMEELIARIRSLLVAEQDSLKAGLELIR